MTRHRPERGSSKTLVAVSIDPVSSSMKLPAARDGTSRTRRGGYGMAKVKRRTRRVDGAGWKVDGGGLEGGGSIIVIPRSRMVCLVANTAIRHHTRPTSYPTSSWPCSTPPVPVGGMRQRRRSTSPLCPLPSRVSRPGNLSRITLIKRFSPSVVAVHGHLSTPPRYREFH